MVALAPPVGPFQFYFDLRSTILFSVFDGTSSKSLFSTHGVLFLFDRPKFESREVENH